MWYAQFKYEQWNIKNKLKNITLTTSGEREASFWSLSLSIFYSSTKPIDPIDSVHQFSGVSLVLINALIFGDTRNLNKHRKY